MADLTVPGDQTIEHSSEGRVLFASYRDVLGSVVLIGDTVVGLGAAVALRDHAPAIALITWGLLVAVSSYGWEFVQRLYPTTATVDGQIRDRMGWVSTIAWGALPWVVYDSLDQPGVVWVLVFVVVFGLGTDLMFQSPTDAPSLDWMLATYVGSYVVAFATELEILAIGATLISASSFYVAARVWAEVNDVLVVRRKQSEQEARIDSLTGLGNRAAVHGAVGELAAEGFAEIYCAFVDIDDFKHLNDNHGYAVGDAALRAVGRELVDRLPPTWTVARFGGDEFVAVGPTAVDFHTLIETSITLPDADDFEIAQSLSVGVTSMPGAEANSAALFREAAAALRFAKRLGKHQVLVMTDELRAVERSQVELGSRAGAALDAGEIEPWAQLLVDLRTGEAVGLELLARWRQPDGSMIPPSEFIPVIEDQGRGPALGIQMITHAIEALASPELRGNDFFISVNISARHLYHRRLPAEVLSLLGRHNVTAGRLVLEITESQHLPSSPIWEHTADQLRTLGIGLAMDDLGTGYATVEQLLAVPFSHVKVDQVLTRALDRAGTAELAAAIASIAKGAGMTAIIEGIETEDDLVAMLDAGYRFGQGYHFHRPEPLALAIARLGQPAADRVEP
ncbi:MAG: bifunctional diguanylate cyclase/phosphodiesterase [Actinomycetota bacterium]